MSAFRALRQLTSVSSRVVARPALRSGRTLRLSAQATPRMTLSATRAFSMTSCRFSEGTSDVVFSQKLAEELKYEKESASTEEPEFLKAFKAQGVWTIEDVVGNDEVTLTRKFGNENIRVMFSIADIQNMEEESGFDQDGEEGGDEDNAQSYPIRVSFSVTKNDAKGSLNVDTMCQEGAFLVDNISFYPDVKLGTELTADADWKRRGLYIGPQFDTLDVAVQEEFEKWLNERGVNEGLATFIPEYSEHKEQKEYVRWLENVKNFIEA
ncbi:putative regulatory protein suaprga1 [Butyriboletus roseoflavus]|nr:putative regulatory protein suaprga1 [Butyriboletus roseoflavus]